MHGLMLVTMKGLNSYGQYMRYRPLGSTGLVVSELGFGTIPILKGSVPVLPNYYNLEDDEAIQLMFYAWNKGCNFFDTAIVPEYGDAEIKLGKFAKFLKRQQLKALEERPLIIADKARFFDGSEMYHAVEISIQNLGEQPDIYFVHQVDYENADAVFGKHGALDALAELKQEGKIRFTGIASHYYDILYRGAADERVDVLQGSGNILERGMLERIRTEPLFSKKGLVINKVYAAGLLPKFFQEKELIAGVLSYPISTALIGIGTYEEADKALLSGAYLHISSGIEPNEEADKAFLSNANLRISSGIGTCDETDKTFLREHANADCMAWDKVIAELRKHFQPIPCDRCQRCRCPYGTEIHTVFRQYNYFFMGKDNWALKKLDLGIRESAAACNQCTNPECIRQCPMGLYIPKLMQEVKKLVEIYLK